MRYHIIVLAALVSFCTATAQTLVNVRVLLEGACMSSDSGVMRTDLRENLVFPLSDPYALDTAHTLSALPENVVDWIALEFRTEPDVPGTIVLPALLRSDGQVISEDGLPLRVPEDVLPHGRYYIVVSHRNHIDIMSAEPAMLDSRSILYDFTSGANRAYSPGGVPAQTECDGIYAMCMGDVVKNNALDSADSLALPREGIVNFLHYSGYDMLLTGQGWMTGAVVRVASRNTQRHTIRRSFVPNARVYRAREYAAESLRPAIKRILPELAGSRKAWGIWKGTFNAMPFPGNRLTLSIEHIEGNYLSVQWAVESPDTTMGKYFSRHVLKQHTACCVVFSADEIRWKIPAGTHWYDFRAKITPDGSNMNGAMVLQSDIRDISCGLVPTPLPFSAERTGRIKNTEQAANKSIQVAELMMYDSTCSTGLWNGLYDTGDGQLRPLWLWVRREQDDTVSVEWVLDDTTASETAHGKHSALQRFTARTVLSGNTLDWSHHDTVNRTAYHCSAFCYGDQLTVHIYPEQYHTVRPFLILHRANAKTP